jgi:hypothetical protein
MVSLDRVPFRLLLALAWAVVWGLRTVAVRTFDALTATAPTAVYLDVAVAVTGAAAMVVGLAVLTGSRFARFVVVTALLVFVAVEAPGVAAGAPLAVAVVAAHLVAAVLVWRTSLAPKSDRSNLDARSGTRIGVN